MKIDRHKGDVAYAAWIAKVMPLLSLIVGMVSFSLHEASANQLILDKGVPATKTQQLVNSQLNFLNGSWEGTYTCRQGLTNLKLVIDVQSLDNIDAVFVFSAHPSQPTVPSGSFKMVGTYKSFNSPDIPSVLNLQGTTWINRPNGYNTVDLSANVDNRADTISGNVTTSGCSTFTVTKVKNSAL